MDKTIVALIVDFCAAVLPTALFWFALQYLPWVAESLGLVVVGGETVRGCKNQDGSYQIVVRDGERRTTIHTRICPRCGVVILPVLVCACGPRTSRRALFSQRANVLS